MSDFIIKRKNYLIISIVFMIVCLMGFSFAYFQRTNLIGNISDNKITVNTLGEGEITRSFITTYDNGTMEVETGVLNLSANPFNIFKKFKVKNIYDESQAISINWNLITSSINNSYSYYILYQCNEENYNNSTIETISSLCSILSPTTGNILPSTGEKSKLHAATELVLSSNSTNYYVVVINIGVENNGKSFQANIKVKDRRTNTLSLNLNGGSISSATSMDLQNGSSITLPLPTKDEDAFFEWEILSGVGASVLGDDFYMGSTDINIKAVWLSEKFSYTSGTYSIIDDGNHNFRIKFLTDGTFIPQFNMMIDLFLVGGGGGGGYSTTAGFAIRGGGGSGYTNTISSISIESELSYPVDIGDGGAVNTAGSSSTAFENTAAGGGRGAAIYYTNSGTIGGAGGSGGGAWGAGGTNGGNGANKTNYSSGGPFYGGKGQGTTTREFGEASGVIYAYGGAGGNDYAQAVNPPSFTGNNTGTGGNCSAAGSSGVIIIRNHR